jgi:dihydroceramide fatty acyl 2-hydroxylase
MFERRWMERLSRTHPAAPFLFWLPALCWPALRAVQSGLGALTLTLLATAGVLLWSLLEYVIHRFIFHHAGTRPWQRRLHFLVHGVHHEYPRDADRLVMPLGVSIPAGVAFYLGLRAALGPAGDPVFVGLVLGYLAYDGMHYAIHHFPMRSRWARRVKRHHMIHHHAEEGARWGVSSPLWDWVFGTMGGRASG